MIPKIIHCFWAGGPKTKLAENCLASWRKYAPGWEIVEWNLETRKGPPQEPPHESVRLLRSGFPSPLGSDARFLIGAVKNKKWAFVADWARFAALEREGGLYLDFDVELVKPIDELPGGEWVSGEWTASGGVIANPGSGIALEKGSPIARAMLDYYATAEFTDKVTVGEIMEGIGDRGLGVRVLDPEVMSPIGVDGKMHRTEKTVGIHWYAMSWASPKQKILQWMSWHGMRPLINAMLWMRNRVRG